MGPASLRIPILFFDLLLLFSWKLELFIEGIKKTTIKIKKIKNAKKANKKPKTFEKVLKNTPILNN